MTAEIIAKKFHNHTVTYNKALYNEEVVWPRDALKVHFDVVRKARHNTNILMIVGHNNDLSEFASYLANESVPSMKKWAVIVLSLPEDADWKSVKPGTLKFIYYLTPHFLRLEALDK
jgi:phosphohistidine phosphatase SixA